MHFRKPLWTVAILDEDPKFCLYGTLVSSLYCLENNEKDSMIYIKML